MKVQIEVTTRCNFDCFYCAGRDMEQKDMSYENYLEIIKSHTSQHGIPHLVSLQGEGEPTLNKSFFKMAAHVRSIGSDPYSITNGTYKYPDHFTESFTKIGVSLDSLNPIEATEIGRHNLDRVINFILEVKTFLDVTIQTVAIASDVDAIGAWCREHNLKHIVQYLQPKPDYQYRYPQRIVFHHKPKIFRCDYIADDRMRYYTIDSIKLPCPFIKDTSSFVSTEDLLEQFSRKEIPKSCTGCTVLK